MSNIETLDIEWASCTSAQEDENGAAKGDAPDFFPNTESELLNHALLNFDRLTTEEDGWFFLDAREDYSIAFTSSPEEFAILLDVLVTRLFLEVSDLTGSMYKVRFTRAGKSQINILKKGPFAHENPLQLLVSRSLSRE